MMEAPKRIWIGEECWFTELQATERERNEMTEYVRMEAVNKFISRIPHHVDCGAWKPLPDGERALFVEDDCTCGLSDLIKEIRG